MSGVGRFGDPVFVAARSSHGRSVRLAAPSAFGPTLGDMTGAQRELIVRDPNICHGQAVVKGTRVMVSVILDALAAGMTEDAILAEYPSLTVDGIRAAAAYGAELARDEYPAVAGQ